MGCTKETKVIVLFSLVKYSFCFGGNWGEVFSLLLFFLLDDDYLVVDDGEFEIVGFGENRLKTCV